MRSRARLLLRERFVIAEGRFADITIWHVPRAVPGSAHRFKYRLAYVVEGVCVLRFDNETSKGDHKHIGEQEQPYSFDSVDQLIADFWDEVAAWSRR